MDTLEFKLGIDGIAGGARDFADNGAFFADDLIQ